MILISIKKAFTFKVIKQFVVLSHNDACLSAVFEYADCGLNCLHTSSVQTSMLNHVLCN